MSILPPVPYRDPIGDVFDVRTKRVIGHAYIRPSWSQWCELLRMRVGGGSAETVTELEGETLDAPVQIGRGADLLGGAVHQASDVYEPLSSYSTLSSQDLLARLLDESFVYAPQWGALLAHLHQRLALVEQQLATEQATSALLAETLRRVLPLFPADTGWSVSNVTPDKSFDADTVVVAELADVVGTLLTTLLAKGILTP